MCSTDGIGALVSLFWTFGRDYVGNNVDGGRRTRWRLLIWSLVCGAELHSGAPPQYRNRQRRATNKFRMIEGITNRQTSTNNAIDLF